MLSCCALFSFSGRIFVAIMLSVDLVSCLCRVSVCRLFDSCMDALQLGCLALFAAQLLILLGSLRFSAACLHFSGVSSCKLVHGPLSS